MGSPGPPNLVPYNTVDPEPDELLEPKEEVERPEELSPYHELQDPNSEQFMLEDGVYIVEKIVNKRIFGAGPNRRIEYLIKWKDFPTSDNTWEPIQNLAESCPLLIQEYESKYGIIHHSHVESQSQHQSLPNAKRVRKRKRKRLGGSGSSSSSNSNKPIKEIEEILGATDCSGELMFYVKFSGTNDTDIVPSKILNLQNPQVVIRYYESIISLERRSELSPDYSEEPIPAPAPEEAI